MNNLLKSLVFVFMASAWSSLQGQNPKAAFGTFVLKNATIETITNGVIENGTLVIRNGKIESVGTNVQVPQQAEVIDCRGMWIYPGMIDTGTRLGLTEFGQVPQATDASELGDVIPQMSALTAVNPNSAAIPVTRVSGVTTVLTLPQGDLLAGTAALINLHGYTPDQMFAGFEGMVLYFPRTGRRGPQDRRTDEEISKATSKAMDRLNEVWEKAVQYHKIDSATKGNASYYPEMQSMLSVVRGEMALIVEVNAAKDILSALKWVKEKKVQKVILSGVAEGWRVADEIAKAKIPVLAGPVLELPTRDYDRYDKAYANPGLMRKAGVKVALKTMQNSSANYRNLPYNAGFAATYGMGRDEALKAVTIVPAEIFGVADKLGSIEAGKRATFFVCDGDPFETKTQVSHVFIDGWKMPMVSRQTLLYDEFLQREPGLTKEKK